jgi:hypothetical protein
MNKPHNIQNTNICNGIFHISFFKGMLVFSPVAKNANAFHYFYFIIHALIKNIREILLASVDYEAHKMIHQKVTIPLPPYLQKPTRTTRQYHPRT